LGKWAGKKYEQWLGPVVEEKFDMLRGIPCEKVMMDAVARIAGTVKKSDDESCQYGVCGQYRINGHSPVSANFID